MSINMNTNIYNVPAVN